MEERWFYIPKPLSRSEMRKMNVTKIPKKTISVIEPKRSLIVNREQYHQRRVAAYCRVSTDSEEQLTSYTKDRKSTRLNSSHVSISYAVFCLKKKKYKYCTINNT